MIFAGLLIILALVLFLPFLTKKVEENLEVFLFIMGCVAVSITRQWSTSLIKEAFIEPIKITLAVFLAGLAFSFLQKAITHNVNKIANALGLKIFAFLLVVLLGLISSVITAIIAALVLVEIITALKLDKQNEIRLIVLSCFSIGLGAALTPIGEPLSTIAIAKLKGEPFRADFLFLFRNLAGYIIPGIVAFGLLGSIFMPEEIKDIHGLKEGNEEKFKDIFLRASKVYVFIMALIFLGRGFKPIVDLCVAKMPYQGLYWLNSISAIVDNATLTAAEIGTALSLVQIKSALMGLLIAGGMLIPGNIPNIIAAGKLKIKSSEWAKFGAPIGLAAMLIYFFLLH